MFLLIPLWAVLFVQLVGVGLLLGWLWERTSGGRLRGGLSAFQTMWSGYCGVLACLLVLSLFMPIARPALALLWVPSAAGWVVRRREVARHLRQLRLRPRIWLVTGALAAIAAVATAYAACDRVTAYDTNLYHLQVVKWITNYSAVPGLANLHLRFGYDNSVHLFAGLVDAYWQGVAVHATNGFLMAAVLVHWGVEIIGARTPRGRLRRSYCLLTLPFLLAKLWYIEVASLSADLPLAILSLVLVLELLSLPRSSGPRVWVHLALVMALGAAVTTTKLGGLPLFVVTCVVVAIIAWRRVSKRVAVAIGAVPAIVMLGWLVRNAVLSGWLVFPVFGKLPLAWSVHRDVAATHLGWIESWARLPQQMPDQVLGHGFLHWFVPWFDGFRQTHEMILIAISGVLLARRIAVGSAGNIRPVVEWGAIVACVLALAQWFVGAPDLRFGGFLFWLLPAVLAAPLLAQASRTTSLVLALVVCTWNGGLTPRLDEIVPKPFNRPVAPPHPPVHWVQTGPSTLVSQPDKGDQCGDATLPCTPEPGSQTLRDPDSLGGGFYVAPSL